MKATSDKELYFNSRTLEQPKWHWLQLSWFQGKMDWQYREAGIRFIPIPWTIKENKR